MNTFVYRDARRQRLADALAALQPDLEALREPLEREQTALAAEGWTVSDRTYLAVAEDWTWGFSLLLKDAINADPVFAALGTSAAISDEQVAAIESVPRGRPGGPPADFMTKVRDAVGNDETILSELVHAAHHAWLEQPAEARQYPFDDVGVLLPLRLETLFDAPGSLFNDDGTRWKLSLRVMPDEASICRDDPYVSAGELGALGRFWQSVRQPGAFDPAWLDGDDAGVAWDIFTKQVPGPRAAWLVTRVTPVIDGDEMRVELPADMPDAPQPNRVGGLPPELRVWATTRDAANAVTRHAIGRLPMDEATTIDPAALTLPLPDTHANTRDVWWNSWETAKTVGLGGEWLLDEGLTPDALEAIYVIGIGDESPGAHFRAQSDAGEMGVLRLGAPTNTVHGAPAADLATNDADWRAIARVRLQQQIDPNNTPATTSGSNLERHLTGTNNVLPFFPGADAPDDTCDSQRMAQALWPALLGEWLTAVWNVEDDAFRVNRWAFPPRDVSPPVLDEVRKILHVPCEDGPIEPTRYNFCPEGPLMPLRIGDQPYGLLPTTALSQWQLGDVFTTEAREQRRVEAGMARTLTELRTIWAAAARRGGTVVGASSAQFASLLARDAISTSYISRSFIPASSWAAPYQLDADMLARWNEVAQETHRGAAQVMGDLPKTPYLAGGAWRHGANAFRNCAQAGMRNGMSLALVEPCRSMYVRIHDEHRRMPFAAFLALVFDQDADISLADIFARWWPVQDTEGKLHILPDSLLIRLLVYTTQLSNLWLRTQFGGGAARTAMLGQLTATRAIACELDQPAWNPEEKDPATGQPIFRIAIPDERRAQLERAFRATLDSAAHRIDPWITGFAWQRLKQHSVSPRSAHRLGAYGWVDGPFIGTPGPTDAGRLHTPSYSQTLAAIILRDKFLSSERVTLRNQDGRNPWAMNITSSKARLAEEIADEVRLGFHIYEIIGRQVEQVIGTHQGVKELRTSPVYAMRPERRDPNEVCNGYEALRGLLAGDGQFPLDDGQRRALTLIQAALDTYGDLLMADGVMQVINRQPERAAETMDAAAGFSKPPTFEFIRTPPSGYHLENLVVSALPYVPVDGVAADASPVRLADPSLAAFLENRIGSDWVWQAINQDDQTQVGAITLGELGLGPLDALSLSTALLSELAQRTLGLPQVFISEEHLRVWAASDADGNRLGTVSNLDLRLLPAELAALDEATLHERVRTQLGAPADATVEEIVPDDLRLWIALDEHGALLGMATVATLDITSDEASRRTQPDLHRMIRQSLGLALVQMEAPPQHVLLQHLATAMGSRPAAGRDVTPDRATQQALDGAIYAELSGRYTRLYSACQSLIDALRAAADDAERATLVRRALGWGVTTVGEPADREAFYAALRGVEAPVGARPLAELAETVAQALEARLNAAPAPADLAPADQIGAPLSDHEQRKQLVRPDGVPTLAQAIANLAVPQGRLAILAPWPQVSLLDNLGLKIGAFDAALDETWLTVVAAVRPPLARLEALQLELDAPLSVWSSSPGDPWRTAEDQVIKQNLQQRAVASPLAMSLNDRFAAAYGADDAFAGEFVAVGLIDAFSEAVPMPQRSTVTAFGFNAPAARAPQAILLAVPPRLRQHLDADLVQQIVAETRELAHARTAHVEDLSDLQSLMPTTWLRSSGNQRVRLEPYLLFR